MAMSLAYRNRHQYSTTDVSLGLLPDILYGDLVAAAHPRANQLLAYASVNNDLPQTDKQRIWSQYITNAEVDATKAIASLQQVFSSLDVDVNDYTPVYRQNFNQMLKYIMIDEHDLFRQMKTTNNKSDELRNAFLRKRVIDYLSQNKSIVISDTINNEDHTHTKYAFHTLADFHDYVCIHPKIARAIEINNNITSTPDMTRTARNLLDTITINGKPITDYPKHEQHSLSCVATSNTIKHGRIILFGVDLFDKFSNIDTELIKEEIEKCMECTDDCGFVEHVKTTFKRDAMDRHKVSSERYDELVKCATDRGANILNAHYIANEGSAQNYSASPVHAVLDSDHMKMFHHFEHFTQY
jgi:hypothetical protein